MNKYLQLKTIYTAQIHAAPSINLGMTVVIPAFDEPQLLLSLMSLKKCKLPKSDVEVIVIINDSEKTDPKIKDQNHQTYRTAAQWAKKNSSARLKFHILYFNDLPYKKAGVGLARKIGMDEACWRFAQMHNPKGILICFDADSRCDTNYFQAIEEHFRVNPKTPACSVYFEHPISGIEYDETTYRAIILYELHLRYYIAAQRWAGFPFAYQTIGSSMAVRAGDYMKQGGMNQRKAGEDFYFLQKFIELGNFTECNTTRVIPSPRASHRVPFGTGKAVRQIEKANGKLDTYPHQSFIDLKMFFGSIDLLYRMSEEALNEFLLQLPAPLKEYLTSVDFTTNIIEIQSNTSNLNSFKKRFFRWFNAFSLMKYLHYARDNYYENDSIHEAVTWLCQVSNISLPASENPKRNEKNLLLLLRKMALRNET